MQIKSPDQLPSHVYQQLSKKVAENQSADINLTTLLVGLSGGLDSVVLLHLLSSVCAQFERLRISVIHVNHGIHESSDEWAEFCQRYCDGLDIPLQISRHDLESVKTNREAVFRQLRYQVFSDHLPKSGLLLTAHHQGDQAETILFNMFRGGGVRGLRAMKQCVAFAGGMHLRPLLSVSHGLLCEYAEKHNLGWIDDPSNDDIELDRNYIRHQVIPVIERRWPAVQVSISRSGANLIESDQILDEIGIQDVNFCNQPDYPGVIEKAYLAVLNLSRINQLSGARQLNLLRLWILTNTGIAVSADQLHQIDQDLCAQSRRGLFEFKGYQLRVFKDSLYLMQTMPGPVMSIEKPLIHKGSFIFEDLSLRIQLQTTSKSTPNSDINFAARKGGEKIRHHGQNRLLKSLYQHYAIPTWERDLIPLIYQDDRLIAVPGVVLADDCPFDQSSISKYTVDIN